MSADPRSSLTCLRICSNPVEAGLLKSVLEAAGLPCFVHGENHGSLVGPLGFIQVRLMVPAHLAEEADRLLRASQVEGGAPPEPPAPFVGGYRDAYPMPPPPGEPRAALVWRPLHTWLAGAGIVVALVLALLVALDR